MKAAARSLGLLVLLFSLHVMGGEFKLSPTYFAKQTTPKAKAILKDYERFMNKIANQPLHVKLEAVNTYLNEMNARYDDPIRSDVDIWSTRGEFLTGAGGDCEDYTIAKYYTLKDLGVLASSMCLIAVKETYAGGDHMVLGVWVKEDEEPLILDNLSFRVLPLTTRIDLKAHFCLNEKGSFEINDKGMKHKSKKKIRVLSYEKMLERNAREQLWSK